MAFSAIALIWLAGNDVTGVGGADNAALIPAFNLLIKGFEMAFSN